MIRFFLAVGAHASMPNSSPVIAATLSAENANFQLSLTPLQSDVEPFLAEVEYHVFAEHEEVHWSETFALQSFRTELGVSTLPAVAVDLIERATQGRVWIEAQVRVFTTIGTTRVAVPAQLVSGTPMPRSLLLVDGEEMLVTWTGTSSLRRWHHDCRIDLSCDT
ncbi:MAG: hypothetical protein H6737_26570 [Alphaproteobacteria bacterium]|nr:hypothetical protein [Alphaproteobacteria bacterium]